MKVVELASQQLLAKKYVLLGLLALFITLACGYMLGDQFGTSSKAATSPGTCLPVSKGGTGVCSEADLLNKTYPIGAIYISTTNTNPGGYLGGTWQSFGEGRTLVGVGSNKANTDTSEGNTTAGVMNKTSAEILGGEKTHTLTIAEMPSHTHIQNAHHHGQNISANAWTGGAGVRMDWAGDGSGYNAYPQGITTDAAVASNQYTGGNGTHNNIQPYVTVYFWKRVG